MDRFSMDFGPARKALAAVALAVLAAGCTSVAGPATTTTESGATEATSSMYGAVTDGGVHIPAVNLAYLAPQYRRQVVTTPRYIPQEPGTIVVDTTHRFLYLVRGDGTSMRYGIGVGRAGFSWSGEATIKAKRKWPDWYPPKEMVERDPLAAEWADGMPGGRLDNPLGARALYLFQGNKDTLYRLHGTTSARSIGKAVSSGCVRLLNQDMIDLYERVPLGTKVVVLGGAETSPVARLFEPFVGPPQSGASPSPVARLFGPAAPPPSPPAGI